MIKTIIEIIVLMVCVAALGAMVYCLIGSVKSVSYTHLTLPTN